jgi:aspartate aminotransferase-like enzyme
MLTRYGVQIAGGQGNLKGKIFRIGHMGYISDADMLVAIDAVERGLCDLGYDSAVGAGLEAAQRALA